MNIHDTSKTKIIATIGPASSSEDRLKELIRSGIDICRLNFSHGDHSIHRDVIHRIRKINNDLNTHVALLADLQGPKIRIGEMEEEGVMVKDGEQIVFTNIECKCTSKLVHISYHDLPKDVKKGDAILVDDGKVKFEVVSTDSVKEIIAEVIHGGPLFSKKGVNLPDTHVSSPSLTKKDIEDVNFILDHDFDWIALSFVRWASDIIQLKKLIRDRNKKTLVLAKIEKPEALLEIDQIIEESDAIMIARGDLGVEVSFDKVPYIQKQLVNKCIFASKPVVIATQMLESMISNFRPTRAEANDVANAVYDGADTVMLSGETSVGKYPVEAIQSMQQIIDMAEGTEFITSHEHLPDIESATYVPDSVCYNACKMADQAGAKAIVVFAVKEQTAYRLASNRPKAPIYVFTPDEKLIHQLSIVWGVRAFYIDPNRDVDDAFAYSLKTLKHKKLIKNGHIIVHVSSLPLFDFQGVNAIRLSYV
ncbi:MAG: pyruvate kinase [Bacteroidales bacterium]|nr:pyruvate kinase [Bacteroidales bacterium]